MHICYFCIYRPNITNCCGWLYRNRIDVCNNHWQIGKLRRCGAFSRTRDLTVGLFFSSRSFYTFNTKIRIQWVGLQQWLSLTKTLKCHIKRRSQHVNYTTLNWIELTLPELRDKRGLGPSMGYVGVGQVGSIVGNCRGLGWVCLLYTSPSPRD